MSPVAVSVAAVVGVLVSVVVVVGVLVSVGTPVSESAEHGSGDGDGDCVGGGDGDAVWVGDSLDETEGVSPPMSPEHPLNSVEPPTSERSRRRLTSGRSPQVTKCLVCAVARARSPLATDERHAENGRLG